MLAPVWTIAPTDPIAADVPPYFELAQKAMSGEVFRSGRCFHRGHGRIFHFRPGHETFPTCHDPVVQRVIANAARWAAPAFHQTPLSIRNVQAPGAS